MKVEVTDRAQRFFEEKGLRMIRVAARDTFDCSTMVEFFIQEGKQADQDKVVALGNLNVLYNTKAEEEIGETVKVDFVPSQGLKLLAPRGTLAYAQQVKPLDWEKTQIQTGGC